MEMTPERSKEEEGEQSSLTLEVENNCDSDNSRSSSVKTEEDASKVLVISDRPSIYTRQKPIVVLVGPDADEHFIYPGLAAIKSPFFRTKLKDCWHTDGAKTKLPEISSRTFGIIVDWMYCGRLPGGVIEISDDEAKSVSDRTQDAFKAADMLMMVKLQNELLINVAAFFLEQGLWCTLHGLRSAYDDGLHHTKYYQFLLKSAVKGMMSSHYDNPGKWDEALQAVEDRPQVLTDLLRSTRLWVQEPWTEFPRGDLAEFLTTDPCE